MLTTRHVLLLGTLTLLGACSTTATEVPPQTAQGLASLRSSLINGKAQITRTTEAARELTKATPAQLDAQIALLLGEISALETIALKGKTQLATQKAEAKAYFEQWDAELKTMSDDVQSSGEARREDSMASFETLGDELDDLKSIFRPYMDSLTEAAKYLKADKTAAGVKTITPHIEKALKVQAELMSQVDVATKQIDTMLGT